MMTLRLLIPALAASLLLQGCIDDPQPTTTTTPTPVIDGLPVEPSAKLVVVGATADYSSGSHAIVDTEAPYTARNNLATDSNTDLTISAYQQFFYRIDRSNANISKYALSNPTVPLWQCGTGAFSNPYQLVQVAENKAYVLRYGSGEVWIVDPSISDSAACVTGFKTGEIDLAAFDGDGVPDMSAAVLVGNTLFVALQRLTFFSPTQDSQVVAIDITSDTIIDTDPLTLGTQAIELIGRNPLSMQYLPASDLLYVQSVGKYDTTAFGGTAAEYSGGIDAIDPGSYSVTQVVADTASTTQISAMAIVNANQGYLVNYPGYADNSLYRFNPQTGVIEDDGKGNFKAVAGIAHQNISGLIIGTDGQLWILVDSGLTLLNSDDDSIEEILIDTQINPSAAVLITP